MPPRILLAEDDPVGLEFLAAALRELGCEVVAVADGHAAGDAALTEKFDLLVLDHRMPGLDGDRVLEIARCNPRGADNRDTPAIATTADRDPQLHRWLRDVAGFDRVLLKPSSKSQLREALHALGLMEDAAAGTLLDDAAGFAASGSAGTLAALRGLFAAELAAFAREFDDLRRNREALDDRLHRLRAACGFCGATALQAAAAGLSDALRSADPARIARCDHAFSQALAATAEALGPGTRTG